MEHHVIDFFGQLVSGEAGTWPTVIALALAVFIGVGALTRTLGPSLALLLEWFVVLQMIALTVVVVTAVLFRIAGDSFSWYDEVAAIQLSWLTYYGAALAALKRRHIGLDSVLLSIPMPARMGAVILAEIVVIGFFYILADTGMTVLMVLEGDRLVALTWVPVQFTQSVIPIGAALFILCELVSLPDYWRKTAAGVSLEHAEIEEEVETEMKKAGATHGEAR